MIDKSICPLRQNVLVSFSSFKNKDNLLIGAKPKTNKERDKQAISKHIKRQKDAQTKTRSWVIVRD